jgi:hypothetical protein
VAGAKLRTRVGPILVGVEHPSGGADSTPVLGELSAISWVVLILDLYRLPLNLRSVKASLETRALVLIEGRHLL